MAIFAPMQKLKAPLLVVLCIAIVHSAWTQQYEFRGVWIATVMNIDWPPQNASVEAQKADFIRQLDMHQRNGMNAVIVQVRPAGDAFYPSPYEPWSQWLTGTQEKHPCRFMIPWPL